MLEEFRILKELLPGLPQGEDVAVGPGDDCAAVEWTRGTLLLAAVDQLIGDVHYFRKSTLPEAAGRKLMCRNLSDIAAMGGVPKWALLAIAVNGRDADWVIRFCRGAAAAGAQFGVPVIGGDTAALPVEAEAASLSILGEVKRDAVVTRSGAKPGDWVYVTGVFGNSLASGHHLTFTPRLAEGRLLGEGGFASAMLDISDGLLLDAARLAEASQVRLLLDCDAIPLRSGATREGALGDGEDYELFFTVPPERAAELEACWTGPAPLTRIGRVEPGAPDVCDLQGNSLLINRKCGYEH